MRRRRTCPTVCSRSFRGSRILGFLRSIAITSGECVVRRSRESSEARCIANTSATLSEMSGRPSRKSLPRCFASTSASSGETSVRALSDSHPSPFLPGPQHRLRRLLSPPRRAGKPSASSAMSRCPPSMPTPRVPRPSRRRANSGVAVRFTLSFP